MDELEFRQRIIAQPNSTEKDLMEFVEQYPEQQQFVEEMQAFDLELNDALAIEVPTGLADRILANTASAQADEHTTTVNTENKVIDAKQRFGKGSIQLAVAASLFVAVGIFFLNSPKDNSPYTVSEHALAHVYHEIGSLDKTAEISLQAVNEKFSLIGGHLNELPGKVTYLMFCDFKGETGLHMVFESDFGPMTVFIVPSDKHSFGSGSDEFNDQRFAGKIDRGTHADTILIASLGTPIESYNGLINNAIRWL